MLHFLNMKPNINEPSVVPLKTNPLFVITPVSKYLAMALFIILPFLGFWIGTIYEDSVITETNLTTPAVVEVYEAKTETQPVNTNDQMYTSKDGVFSIAYPASKVVQPIPPKQVPMMGNIETVTYSPDKIEVPNMFIVSKVPYSEMKSLFDYDSCCSGTTYFFDQVTKTWTSSKVLTIAGTEGPDFAPVSLIANGVCTLQKKFETNTFYRVKQGDEGVAPDFNYFLMTDQGYAVQFTAPFDLDPNFYKDYAPSAKPDPKLQADAAALLASVKLNGEVQAMEVGCK